MFTQRQIMSAGLMSVYAGCAVLTVNLARLPYRRGALIGVGFGALMHIVVTLIYILIALGVGQWMEDPILRQTSTWMVILLCILVVQVLSAVGCSIMGRYFFSPATSKDTFEREKLYHHLKAKDTGKRSVLHDVVMILEKTPSPEDKRFSSGWILLLGVLSITALLYYLNVLMTSCLNVIFFSVPADAGWWLSIAGQFCIPLIILMLTNLAMIAWLNRDLGRE